MALLALSGGEEGKGGGGERVSAMSFVRLQIKDLLNIYVAPLVG